MPQPHSARPYLLALAVALAVALAGCRRESTPLAPKNQTYAELRAVRHGVRVTPPGEAARAPYARERLADGAGVTLEAGGLAWVRRDGGATLLVAGPAQFTLRRDAIVLDRGKVFVDTYAGGSAELATPQGALHLSGVRASLTVGGEGSAQDDVDAYVLKGELKTEAGLGVLAGEALALHQGGATKRAVLTWDDWTGGLATTDEAFEPAPFGIGTVAARPPGSRGQARSPLTIQKLEVRVTIDHDLAITEVDEVFFNPSPAKVEGIYKFRTPAGATLHRFGVDHDGAIVWGRVKEKGAAAAQYQANVYEGSVEDPALLEWDAKGVYAARLYPIEGGGTRRVVTRYAEWLARQGDRGERRLYVYPMAAEGAEASLPRIEEFRAIVDLAKAGASDFRSGMHGAVEGTKLIAQAYDLVPRADLAVELFDAGEPPTTATAYRARHVVVPELLANDELAAAEKEAKSEADYVLVPVRPVAAPALGAGLDVAIVVDTSAATAPESLAVARASATSLLAHLAASDHAAVWAGDARLRPVAPTSEQFLPVDAARRDALDAGLARLERGGATDLGAVLVEAASQLDPARRGIVVYVGDGRPTVGELVVADLRERLSRLPHPPRIFALGVGDTADLGVLQGIVRGGFAERVLDAHAGATTALRLLEEAERPVWLGVKVDLGLGVDRLYPRELTSLYADETALVVGRLTRTEPTRLEVTSPGGVAARQLTTVWVPDDGDLQRRWAEGRLAELLGEGAGRAAVVEVGVRYGVLTPFTSFYVPTNAELAAERVTAAERSGMSMDPGNAPSRRALEEVGANRKGNSEPRAAETAQKEAAAFGMIGLLGPAAKSPPKPDQELAPRPAATAAAAPSASASSWGDAVGDSLGAGGLGLSGVGEGGGGRGEGVGLGGIGGIGHAGGGAGSGFGNGHGRLGGAHQTKAPTVRPGQLQILDSSKDVLAATVAVPPVKAKPAVVVTGSVGYVVRLCDPAADQPLEDRVTLWRERLVDAARDPHRVAAVYDDALYRCEAPSWPERARLLHLMLDALDGVPSRVELWRVMFERPTAADILYRGILARVRTIPEMRALHDALGLHRIDPGLLRATLAKEQTPAAKVVKLNELVRAWPDDLELALRLLDAYEDAGDSAGERMLAKRLRSRDDANARLRTAVGEAYLRLEKRPGGGPEDEAEARRAFGEIVEFAVDDPVARRRLGDLLRSHGWYDEAFRQYETLAKLTPDDASVSLLLALASAGMGKVEAAVGWTEQAGLAGAPFGNDQASLARDLASILLARAEDEAVRGGRSDEAKALRERAAKLSSAGIGSDVARVFLTYSHPEVHATLWTGTRANVQPALRGDPLLGLATATFGAARPDVVVEIRMEEEDAAAAARLGAEVRLTVVYDEGSEEERVFETNVPLAPARVVRRFEISRVGIRAEVPR